MTPCRVVCLVLFTAVAARADEAPAPPKAFDAKAIDEYLAKEVPAKGYVGLSVALVRDGKVLLAKGYGKASLKTGAAVDEHTRFAAGSVTKQFTCACVLLLQEDGKLSVSDKVAKYYAGLTKADEITLLDLMNHTAGYPDYYPLDFVDRRMEKAIPLDDLLKEYAGGKLDFAPKTRWSYSNTGYILLGRVIEKVSGKPFAEFLSERILKPVGMTNTVFEPKTDAPGLATGYTSFALGDPEPAAREADGWIHAAGGLYTTPSDLAKWDLALMTGKVLKTESLKQMTTPSLLADGRTRDYACGLAVPVRNGEQMFEHSGAVSGFLTFNGMIPRTRSAVILMTNGEHVDAGSLNRTLVALLLKAEAGDAPPVPKINGPAPKDVALDLLHQLQAGEIKREALGEDYNHFLTPARVAGAKERLKALGEPEKIEVEGTSERGGMEVAVIRFTFKTTKAKGLLYRTPDGKIQEFLLTKS